MLNTNNSITPNSDEYTRAIAFFVDQIKLNCKIKFLSPGHQCVPARVVRCRHTDPERAKTGNSLLPGHFKRAHDPLWRHMGLLHARDTINQWAACVTMGMIFQNYGTAHRPRMYAHTSTLATAIAPWQTRCIPIF